MSGDPAPNGPRNRLEPSDRRNSHEPSVDSLRPLRGSQILGDVTAIEDIDGSEDAERIAERELPDEIDVATTHPSDPPTNEVGLCLRAEPLVDQQLKPLPKYAARPVEVLEAEQRTTAWSSVPAPNLDQTPTGVPAGVVLTARCRWEPWARKRSWRFLS